MPSVARVLKIIQGLLLAVLVLVPLVFSHNLLFPYAFVKTILFYTLVELALVFWLPLVVSAPAYRPRISLLTSAVSVFFIALALTSFTGVDVAKSVWSGYERMMGLWTYAHVYMFFLMLASVLRSDKERSLFFSASLASATLVALIGIIEGFGSAARVESTIGNAAFLAAYLLFHIFIGLSIVLREKHVSGTAMSVAVSFALMGWALILTQARAAFVGVTGGLGMLALLFLFWGDAQASTLGISHAKAKKYLAGLLIAGVLGAGGSIVFHDSVQSVLPQSLVRLLTFDTSDRTSQGRLLAWHVSWEGWKERPLLGWGIENYNILFDRHYDAQLFNQEPWFDRAHNIVFDMLGTTGAVGLIAYAGMIAAACITLVRVRKKGMYSFWASAVFVSLLVAYILHTMFAFDTLVSYMSLFLLFGILASEGVETITSHVPKNNIPMAGVMITLLLILPAWYYGAARPFLENRSGLLGWNAFRHADADAVAIGYFNEGLQYGTYGNIELNRFVAEYVFEFIKQGGKRPRESLERIMIYATERIEENIALEPLNVKWLMYQGELYNLAAAMLDPKYAPRAEEYFSRARAISPARPQIYLELAQARKVQGNIPGMWEAFDTLFTILPDYIIGHINAAVLAIEVGDTGREEAHVSWLLERNEGYRGLRDAYTRAKRFSDAVHVQKLIISFEENVKRDKSHDERATLYQQLAALQNLAGDKTGARVSAEQVRSLAPSRAQEVEAFLKSL